MVRRIVRIVGCKSCRKRFTTSSGSSLCLSCRVPKGEAEAPPELSLGDKKQSESLALPLPSHNSKRNYNDNDNGPMDVGSINANALTLDIKDKEHPFDNNSLPAMTVTTDGDDAGTQSREEGESSSSSSTEVVIVIDSSDDDDDEVVPRRRSAESQDKEHGRIATSISRDEIQTLTASSDNGISVSSADSIRETKGNVSSCKGDDDDVSVVSVDNHNEYSNSNHISRRDDGCIDIAPSEKIVTTQIIQSDDDDGSLHSTDSNSIWDKEVKVCLPSLPEAEEGGATDINITQLDGKSLSSTSESIWEDKVVGQPSKSKPTKEGAALVDIITQIDDESSISSTDSMSSDDDELLEKIAGLQFGDSDNVHDRLVQNANEDINNADNTVDDSASRDSIRKSTTQSDDASSISSNDSLWDAVSLPSMKPIHRGGVLSNSYVPVESKDEDACEWRENESEDINAVDGVSDNQSDGSSISSNDSIWDAVGLPSKRIQEERAASNVSDDELLKQIAGLKFGGSGSRHRKENKSQNINRANKAGGNVPKVSRRKEVKNPYGPSFADIVSASKARSQKKSKDTPIINDNGSLTDQLPPEVPLPVGASWKIVLLMDHREFGCANNFLQKVETKINKHFGGKYSEICTLASADYMFVARLISNSTGEVVDERVLDLVIERKEVKDACQCLISDSKKYKPLSFFEAQMYKLQHCGISSKLFLMEGDEDKDKKMFVGAKSEKEKERRLKRVKSLRMRLEDGEYQGVHTISTRNRFDTIKYLIQQLECFHKSFNPRRPPTKTMEQLKRHINEQMKAPTFLEYLRLRSMSGIGDVNAMKIILDPELDWDKTFISPSSKKKAKSTLEDRATFWKYSKPASKNAQDTSTTVPASTTAMSMKMRASVTSSKRQDKSATINSINTFLTVKDKKSNTTKPQTSVIGSKCRQNHSDAVSLKESSQTCTDSSMNAGVKVGNTKKNKNATSTKGNFDSISGDVKKDAEVLDYGVVVID